MVRARIGGRAMADGTLYIGTRRYSSWSLRGWLAVKLAGLAVLEVTIPLGGDGQTAEVKRISPNGLVPYLEHRGARVWETIAICEYCAEIEPSLWPADRTARALARSVAAEMHGGFAALRQAMPMNLGADKPGVGRSEAVLADVARIEAIWASSREAFGAGGPFLFGAAFTAADAMYAPVVARFLSYAPPLSEVSRAYCAAVRAHPLLAEWYAAAAMEPAEWRLAKYETVGAE
jgi:glutathione S-transferase